MTNVARRNAALAEVARQAVTAAGWSTDPTTEGRAMPPTSDNADQQDHISNSAALNQPTKEIAMETTWRVEQVTERPGILSATLQRVEWFKKNPDYDAKMDEVGGTEGVDEFLDAMPGEPGADVAEVGGTITLDVTDGPELHPLDDVILSLRVVVPVEV